MAITMRLENRDSAPQTQTPPPAQAQVPMPTQKTSVVDEIQKFKELLDDGIITQQEFEDKKRQLLSQ